MAIWPSSPTSPIKGESVFYSGLLCLIFKGQRGSCHWTSQTLECQHVLHTLSSTHYYCIHANTDRCEKHRKCTTQSRYQQCAEEQAWFMTIRSFILKFKVQSRGPGWCYAPWVNSGWIWCIGRREAWKQGQGGGCVCRLSYLSAGWQVGEGSLEKGYFQQKDKCSLVCEQVKGRVWAVRNSYRPHINTAGKRPHHLLDGGLFWIGMFLPTMSDVVCRPCSMLREVVSIARISKLLEMLTYSGSQLKYLFR